jgi:HKD family nuclease
MSLSIGQWIIIGEDTGRRQMNNLFLPNYTEQTFMERIRENLRKCDTFLFSVSFIKKAGLVLLLKDIEAALTRGATGKLIVSTYPNFTDVESLRSFLMLASQTRVTLIPQIMSFLQPYVLETFSVIKGVMIRE